MKSTDQSSPITTKISAAKKRGRPPLTEKEKHAREIERNGKKAVQKIMTAALQGQDRPTGAGAVLLADAPKPAPVENCGVAQRVLGVGFGEDQGGEVPDAEVVLSEAQPENLRRFILIRTACHVPPREIIKDVKETFGITVTSSYVSKQDPTKLAGATLADKHKRLFAEMRHEFHAVIDRIGIGDQGFRITTLHNLLVKAVDSGAAKIAVTILDQVAREKCAGVYAKVPRETEDKRALLARLMNCEVAHLPPLPKPVSALPGAPSMPGLSMPPESASSPVSKG